MKFSRIYDIDNDGYISNGELFQVLKMMVGSNLKDTQLQQIVDKTILFADKDGTEIVRLEGIDSYILPEIVNTDVTFGDDWVQMSNNIEKSVTDDVQNANDIALNEEQLAVSISAKWTNVNSFRATLTVNTWPNSARFIQFSGTYKGPG